MHAGHSRALEGRRRGDGAQRASHGRGGARCSTSRGARICAARADGDGLNVAALRALPAARRRNALRAFIARAGIELPSTAQMMEIAGPLLAARADAQPEVRWRRRASCAGAAAGCNSK